MKQLFLTSEINLVAKDVRQRIEAKGSSLRTAYITTPIERGHENDDLAWHKQNKLSMIDAGFDIFEYSITGKNLDELRQDLGTADVLYVEGGSLVWMMNQTRASGFDVFVREFVASGRPYIGTSTGSFIASHETAPGLCLEDYFEENFNSKGIGLVNFLVMPHWGTEDFKAKYKSLPSHVYGMSVPMIVLTDTQYVWVNDSGLHIIDVVSE